jgi:hypothetical protein
MKSSDGGKGSLPRKQQNYQAYAENYDTIFGISKLEKRLRDEDTNSKTKESIDSTLDAENRAGKASE